LAEIIIEKSDKSNGGAAKNVSLLEFKRSQNIAILVSRVLRMPVEELCSAVIAMNSEVLNLDQLLTLQSILPTPTELDTLRKYVLMLLYY
jgi:hypothetical protein